MRKIKKETFKRINNDIYNAENDQWRNNDSALYMIKSILNPYRINYFKKKIFNEQILNHSVIYALEVGCGSGILTEEIAGLGFETSGIDPSEQSINNADKHAKEKGLNIKYTKGYGEAIPFQNESFDIVFCCDVLEHVRDLSKVISEIARVLKPGGIFIFDTINRSFLSKLVFIKFMQEWRKWAIFPSNLHVWEMFIKPDEIRSLLKQYHLQMKDITGALPNISVFKALKYLSKRAKGEITYKDLSRKISLIESKLIRVLYMGYAVKEIL